jgi:SP family sugar porter-like MFS transporter
MVAALGGLLFGYDWVVIGGAKPFYEQYFNIANSTYFQAWAMSSALIGCLLGAFVSGVLSDLYGRKKLLIFSAVLFTISAVGTGWASGYAIFIVYRLVGGVGIGLASTLSPMYIAEVSPAKYRGRFVSLNQLTIVIGILLAQIVNWLIADFVPEHFSNADILNSWNGQMGWRFMFWAEVIPAILFLILMFFVPESPRWLAKSNKLHSVINILTRIGGKDYAHNELLNIRNSIESKDIRISFNRIKSSGLMRVLILGIVLAIFQQWCGINVIFNYAEEVFKSAGFGVSDILLNIVITGSVNLIFTFVAIFTVDKIGRKKLMLIGAGGLAIIYTLIGIAYFFHFSGWWLLILVILGIACYAMSLAPITWVVLSEIFPNKVRAVAMSAATVALWSASFVLTYSFPILNEFFQVSGTFWLYGIICFAGFFFIKYMLPETKGKSLEEIENEIIKKR